MMPVGPAARANRLVGLFSRLDSHIGHQTVLLPLGEMLSHILIGDALPHEVQLADGANFVHLASPASTGTHPLNGIETLLEQVIRPWLEIALLPHALPIADLAFGSPIAPTQGR